MRPLISSRELPVEPHIIATVGLVAAAGSVDLYSFARRLSAQEDPIIDLGPLTFIDAYGLVGVACLVEHFRLEGTTPRVMLPQNADVSTYLARMHVEVLLSAGLAQVVGPALPVVREHEVADRLLELQTFSNVHEYEGLCHLVWSRLEGTSDPQVVEAIYEALHELAANAIEHSAASRAYLAAQVYNRGKPNEYLVFAIGDCGRGIRASLSAMHRPASDKEALTLALQYDVSSSGEAGRGQGLPTIAEQVASLGGTFVVHSGSTVAQINRAGAGIGATRHLAGTLVGGMLPCRPH